jgi:hypothetical protein
MICLLDIQLICSLVTSHAGHLVFYVFKPVDWSNDRKIIK